MSAMEEWYRRADLNSGLVRLTAAYEETPELLQNSFRQEVELVMSVASTVLSMFFEFVVAELVVDATWSLLDQKKDKCSITTQQPYNHRGVCWLRGKKYSS